MDKKTEHLLLKRAAQIVRSFLSEGYRLRVASECYNRYKLVHSSNGNTVSVVVSAFIYIYKNGRLVKIETV